MAKGSEKEESLAPNVVILFGCFIIDVPAIKIIFYIKGPLELQLISYLIRTNLSVF